MSATKHRKHYLKREKCGVKESSAYINCAEIDHACNRFFMERKMPKTAYDVPEFFKREALV